jgi:hypothetical protein
MRLLVISPKQYAVDVRENILVDLQLSQISCISFVGGTVFNMRNIGFLLILNIHNPIFLFINGINEFIRTIPFDIHIVSPCFTKNNTP